MSEIDSFIWKFKQLLHSGKNAHLEIKSEAGKAFVHLSAEVDVQQHEQQLLRAQPRNGPARQRRREKRAAERDAAVIAADHEVDRSAPEKVARNVNTRDVSAEDTPPNKVRKSESKDEEVAEQVTKKKEKVNAENASSPVNDEVEDEFCPNEHYDEAKSNPTPVSYCEAAAPPRKLAGFDYFSMYPSDSD